MTVPQKIRALAELQARTRLYELLRGRRAAARLLGVEPDEDEIIVAKGDVLDDAILSRISMDAFERLQVDDHWVQDQIFEAIDKYREIADYVDFTNLKGRLTNIARDRDPTITSITLNRRKKSHA